jgi:hypothetical protein
MEHRMSTLELKELSHPAGEVIKIAAGKTLDLKTQGSVTMPTGSVLQVVYGSTTTEVNTTSSTYVDTGITATITPSSTSNKILVTWSLQIFNSGSAGHHRTMLVKDSTQLREFGFNMYAASSTLMAVSSQQHLDSPSTTSATTYKLQVKVGSGSVNCQYDDSNGDGVSTITLMEIQG